MQAIISKFLCPTDTKGARIKATCERGSLTISYNHDLRIGEENHRACVDLLLKKFIEQDVAKYGEASRGKTGWGKPYVTGQLHSGEYVHVFVTTPQYQGR